LYALIFLSEEFSSVAKSPFEVPGCEAQHPGEPKLPIPGGGPPTTSGFTAYCVDQSGVPTRRKPVHGRCL